MKKQNHVSLILIQGSQSFRFYSVAKGRLPQSNAVPGLAERTHDDEVFAFSHAVFHPCTGAQLTKSSSLDVPTFLIPLYIIFSCNAFPSPFAWLVPAPNHLVLSPFLHLLAWGRCPCNCHQLISVKASAIPCYSCGGN